MNLDKLNNWLTLAANIGVLAGILLVAYEVRQNQELLELDYKLTLLDSASLEVEVIPGVTAASGCESGGEILQT